MKERDRTDIEKLYNDRFDEKGASIETVGWGSLDDQLLRFEILFREIDPTGKMILDVGCGLGDLVPYLDRKTNGDFQYIGIDLSEKLIGHAQKTYGSSTHKFKIGELLSLDLPQVDIIVLSGALSYKIDDNESYTRQIIKKMFELSKEVISLNFLTKYVDYELDKNYHYQPETMFAFAKELTPWVSIYHDYPLWEFTLQLRRNVTRR